MPYGYFTNIRELTLKLPRQGTTMSGSPTMLLHMRSNPTILNATAL